MATFFGRVGAAMFAVVLLGFAFLSFALSCALSGILAKVGRFIKLDFGTTCIPMIPAAAGAIVGVLLVALAVVAIVQVFTG